MESNKIETELIVRSTAPHRVPLPSDELDPLENFMAIY